MKFVPPKLMALSAIASLLLIAASVQGQASAPGIPYRSTTGSDAPEPQQWLLVIVGCALLLLVIVLLLRRYGSRLSATSTFAKRVRVMERSVIAHNVQLVVVEYDQRRLLLSVSPAGAHCLRDDDVKEPGPPTGGAA